MKALYANYNGVYYHMYEKVDNNTLQAINGYKDVNQSTKIIEKGDEVSVNTTLGVIGDSLRTNKEMCDIMLEDIKKQGIKKLTDLEPFFEVSMDYTLMNDDTNEIIDDGVITRHIRSIDIEQNFYYMLGVDVNNEMYNRIVKRLTTDFTLNYRESSPCGIIGKKQSNIVLIIHAIRIHQLIRDTNYEEDLNDRIDSFSKSTEGVAITRESYSKKYNRPEDVVLFDSTVDGFEFKPISFSKSFRKLHVTVSAVLNHYMLFAEEKTVNDALCTETVYDDINENVILGGDSKEKYNRNKYCQ